MLFRSLCVQTLEALKDGTVVREPQGESTTEYARMLDKGMGRIDWSKDAKSIECLIRGLNPWPSAYTEWNGRTMKIWEADVADIDEGREPGTVIRVERDGFCVQTGRGSLKVRSLQIPGKKRMDAGAFLRGYQVDVGMVLS